MDACVQPVDSSLFRSLASSLDGLPSFERAELSVSLAKSYSEAYVAYCSAVSVPRAPSPGPSVVGGSSYKVCGSPCRRLGTPALTGSGYWSVPSDISLDASKINSDGRCYLSMAARGSRTALYRKLGPWPTLSRLLSAPSGRFCRDAMGMVSFSRVSDGTWHLSGGLSDQPSVHGGVSALGMLARVVDDNSAQLDVGSPRWDGTLLRDLQLEPVPRGALDVPGVGDKVGGSVLPPVYTDERGFRVPFTVYLGGQRAGVGNTDWRSDLIGGLVTDRGYSFARPGSSGVGFYERGLMSHAGAFVIYFGPGPSSPVSMAELGLLAHSSRLIVCCDVGCDDRRLVYDVCTPRGVKVFSSLDSVVGLLELWRAHPPAPRPSVYSPVLDAAVSGPLSCRLPWDQVAGMPEVSACERLGPSGVVVQATYRCTRELVSGVSYSFRVPGESGSVFLRRAPGLMVYSADDEVSSRYVLTCGRWYEFSVSYSLSVFSPTFEYRAGSCAFADGVGCSSVGAVDDPAERSEYGVPSRDTFLRLFRPGRVSTVLASLGNAPTLQCVLSFPADFYSSSDDLGLLSFYRVGGAWVVGDLGLAASVVGAVTGLARRGGLSGEVTGAFRGEATGTVFPCPDLKSVII